MKKTGRPSAKATLTEELDLKGKINPISEPLLYGPIELHTRGWTRALIKRFLKEPDVHKPHPLGALQPMPRYERSRVHAAEAKAAWKAARAAARVHSKAKSLGANAQRAQELEAVQKTSIHVAVVPLNDAREMAIEAHRERLKTAGSVAHHPTWEADADADTVKRITVEYIRQKHTEYDDSLKGLVAGGARVELRKRVYAAIGTAYPDLAATCAQRGRGPDLGVQVGNSTPPFDVVGAEASLLWVVDHESRHVGMGVLIGDFILTACHCLRRNRKAGTSIVRVANLNQTRDASALVVVAALSADLAVLHHVTSKKKLPATQRSALDELRKVLVPATLNDDPKKTTSSSTSLVAIPVWLMTHEGQWISGTLRGECFSATDPDRHFNRRTSGSPVFDKCGRVAGLVSGEPTKGSTGTIALLRSGLPGKILDRLSTK